jgi:hypothetical protein
MIIGGVTALYGISHFIFKSEEEELRDQYRSNSKVVMNFTPIANYDDQSKTMSYGAGIGVRW